MKAAEAYELWAATWDSTPSPIVALEERTLGPWLEASGRVLDLEYGPGRGPSRPGALGPLSSGRVLDVGCGTGRWASRLGAFGLDLSPAMLAIAARKPGLRGRLAVAELSALPVRSASADLVLCTLTLGHAPDARAAMGELARVAAPGGRVIVTDFHPAAAAAGWRRTFRAGGQVYEIENHVYAVDDLCVEGLVLEQCKEATIGEPEREWFARAGRPELFEPACRTPAVLLLRWRRL